MRRSRSVSNWTVRQDGGTHSGPAFGDFLIGSLPAASGRKMHFTGTTVLRVENGKMAEDVGLDDGVTALQQLGLRPAACSGRGPPTTDVAARNTHPGPSHAHRPHYS